MANLFQYTGLNALPVDSICPQLQVNQKRAPGVNDWQNQQIGNFWLYTNPNNNTQQLWVLVSLFNNQAKWVELTANSGLILTLTGNSGGAVAPTSGNINIVGDGTTCTVVGNPGTSTLTISVITGSTVIETLTGNSGGAVSPTTGNINVVGSGVITVVGNPGTSTLTITPSGAIASSFPTDSGTATPSSGVLHVLGGTSGRDINTSGSGSTIHIDLDNAITLGDLSSISAGSPALNAVTGDIVVTAGNITFPYTNSTATQGAFIINTNGHRFITVNASNTFVGENSGLANLSGTHNHSFGGSSLATITSGTENTALGGSALQFITTGSYNCAIGYNAGVSYVSSESSNICINSGGTAAESNVLRIGSGTGTGIMQLANTFISGIYGVTTTSGTTSAVLVSNTNQLGTISSSERFKKDIQDMEDQSSAIMNLRPVTFQYRKHVDYIKQFGLIAEEVNEIMPEIVNYDDEGNPFAVRYHDLPVMLLNELQKLSKRVADLEVKMSKCSNCKTTK